MRHTKKEEAKDRGGGREEDHIVGKGIIKREERDFRVKRDIKIANRGRKRGREEEGKNEANRKRGNKDKREEWKEKGINRETKKETKCYQHDSTHVKLPCAAGQ